MPIKQLVSPTIEEVKRQMVQFEEQYGIDTETFLADECRIASLDEDDAVDWHFLAEQLRVLQTLQSASLYSRAERSTSLKNCDSVMDKLAA